MSPASGCLESDLLQAVKRLGPRPSLQHPPGGARCACRS